MPVLGRHGHYVLAVVSPLLPTSSLRKTSGRTSTNKSCCSRCWSLSLGSMRQLHPYSLSIFHTITEHKAYISIHAKQHETLLLFNITTVKYTGMKHASEFSTPQLLYRVFELPHAYFVSVVESVERIGIFENQRAQATHTCHHGPTQTFLTIKAYGCKQTPPTLLLATILFWESSMNVHHYTTLYYL